MSWGGFVRRRRALLVAVLRPLDRDRIGQRLHADPSSAGLDEEELIERYRYDRDWYFVGRPGSSNAGHDVWSRIRSEENRRAVIEYLKTL